MVNYALSRFVAAGRDEVATEYSYFVTNPNSPWQTHLNLFETVLSQQWGVKNVVLLL